MPITLNGTTGIAGVDGSAATPAVQGADSNTGMFFPAADTIAFTEGGTEVARFDSNGNFGLGVTPSAWESSWKSFDIGLLGSVCYGYGEVNVGNNFYRLNSGAYRYKTTETASNYAQVGGVHYFYNAPSGTAGSAITFAERARISANGNLMLGSTTDDTARINARRAVSSTTKTANVVYFGGVAGSGADAHIHFTDAVANNYYFGGNNSGAYVMSNTQGVRLASGGTSWASDSDERVKDIIEPISDAANKVSSLRAVIGKYKTDETGVRRSFLIAQDVQAVLPEAVFDEQGTLMLQYTDVIPLLVAAMKEQQATITALTARITALEAAQ